MPPTSRSTYTVRVSPTATNTDTSASTTGSPGPNQKKLPNASESGPKRTSSTWVPTDLVFTTLFEPDGSVGVSYEFKPHRLKPTPPQHTQRGYPLPGAFARIYTRAVRSAAALASPDQPSPATAPTLVDQLPPAPLLTSLGKSCLISPAALQFFSAQRSKAISISPTDIILPASPRRPAKRLRENSPTNTDPDDPPSYKRRRISRAGKSFPSLPRPHRRPRSPWP